MSHDLSGSVPAANAPGLEEPEAHGGNFWILALGSIGVVFGDIGTSPLYALQTALHSSRTPASASATSSASSR